MYYILGSFLEVKYISLFFQFKRIRHISGVINNWIEALNFVFKFSPNKFEKMEDEKKSTNKSLKLNITS